MSSFVCIKSNLDIFNNCSIILKLVSLQWTHHLIIDFLFVVFLVFFILLLQLTKQGQLYRQHQYVAVSQVSIFIVSTFFLPPIKDLLYHQDQLSDFYVHAYFALHFVFFVSSVSSVFFILLLQPTKQGQPCHQHQYTFVFKFSIFIATLFSLPPIMDLLYHLVQYVSDIFFL